jgi:hypothetical protein
MNKYVELRDKQQKDVDNLPVFFAFSNSQFKAGMEKNGLTIEDTDKIYKLGNTGGYYLKTNAKLIHDTFEKHEQEKVEAMKDDEYLYGAFRYELANHEFCITLDATDTLDVLGITEEELLNDKRMFDIYVKAKVDYLKNCENE